MRPEDAAGAALGRGTGPGTGPGMRPPPRRDAPDDATTVRPMRWWDIEAVLDLERDLFGADAWSPAMFWSELAESDTRHFLVAEDEGRIVGYAGLAAYPDIAYVQTIAVTRERWGAGLGPRLLQALLDEAARRGKDRVALEVRVDNARAQAMYERFGFRPVAVRKGYYQPSNVDGLVMVRDGG